MSRAINPFGLRMPASLKKTLDEMAAQSGRSLNSEIVMRLDHSVKSGYKPGEYKAEEDEGSYRSSNIKYMATAFSIANDLLEMEGKTMDDKEKAEFVQLIMDLLKIDSDPDIVKTKIQNVVSITPFLKKTAP